MENRTDGYNSIDSCYMRGIAAILSKWCEYGRSNNLPNSNASLHVTTAGKDLPSEIFASAEIKCAFICSFSMSVEYAIS